MAPSVAAVVATSIQPRRRFTTNHRIVALLVIPLLAAGVAMMLSDYSNALYYPPWTFTVVFSPLAVLYSMTTRAVFHLRPSLFQSETTSIPIIPSSATALVNSHHHRRLALITGANTGIGYETAKALVQTHDVDVILACRSHDKATAAAALINQGRRRSEDDDARAIVLPNAVLDLQSPTSIREYVKELARLDYSAIDILINNAGRNTQPTDDDDSNKDDKRNGLFQANFLGHFQLTAELLERNLLRASVISSDDKTTLLPRIVNLSSVMHHFVGGGATGSIESADTWRKIMTTSGNNDNAYALSKLAMILFTRQLNIRYGDRLRVLAVNPGAV
jgi:NAD(P)-dependent dehydrogenase (short-subunit alcohol dehydrogenase family)